MKDMCLSADRAIWHALCIFLAILVGLVVFLRLVNALSESLSSMIHSLLSTDCVKNLMASSIAMASAVYIEHLSDSLS